MEPVIKMLWDVEPQQMLYVTAAVAVYAAVLSTLNFVREQRKDEIRLKITAKNALLDPPMLLVESIYIVNNSSFEIEITSLGFALNSQDKLFFFPDAEDLHKLPDSIPSKKSRDYLIRVDRIKTLLKSNGINRKISLKPFVTVNSKHFYGKPFLFDPEATV
ncbi:MAG: hypothetical protein RIG63_20210 [Coleofasciculus chthonoplastes F3-SA18-01]|uniref:hypothetical protein n=1 Tax=Coleofasciculus chthonoplastes TaxID=64178 RepID=UPI003304B917